MKRDRYHPLSGPETTSKTPLIFGLESYSVEENEALQALYNSPEYVNVVSWTPFTDYDKTQFGTYHESEKPMTTAFEQAKEIIATTSFESARDEAMVHLSRFTAPSDAN